MKKTFQILAIALLAAACGNNKEKENETQPEETVKASTEKTVPNAAAITMVKNPEWVKSANIYEVNIRQYTPEGTIKAFTKHLPRLQKMGVDILWIMPIQPIGIANRKGSLGSYYSIRNFGEVASEYGTMDDFRMLVEKAHELGMKVMLDWAANHTAFDHHWVKERYDFYTTDAKGKYPIVALDNDGKPTDWTDVADLNYAVEDLKGAMTLQMRNWLIYADIDGFRCDMAGMVPFDFWEHAIPTLKIEKPTLFFLAEWEDPKLFSQFNMDYGWEMHHTMNDVAKGTKPASAIQTVFAKQLAAYPSGAMRMYFTSNHDENSWQGTEFERMGQNYKNMFVLAATLQNSMPLIYSGQEAGLKKRLRFFDKDTIDWSNTSDAKFYGQILKLKHETPALWNGDNGGRQTEITTQHPETVYAFSRVKTDSKVLVFLNFGAEEASLTNLDGSILGTYTDLSGSKINLNNKAKLIIPAYGYLILRI